jgi:predicted DNA binding CopG/RHH family protein
MEHINKLIRFSIESIEKIQKDAEKKGISFTEMLRRIIDKYYEEIDAKP